MHYAHLAILRIPIVLSVIIKGLAFLPCCTLIISHQVFQDLLLQEAAEPIAVTGKGGTVHTQRYS